MSWLATPSRPIEAKTDERLSSTGMPAARKAPKARTRMISVIGIESFSAFWKSAESLSSMAFSNVMPPAWSMVTSGCDCSTAVDDGRHGRELVDTVGAVAGQVPAHHRGATIVRELRRIDGGHVGRGVEALGEVGGDGAVGGVADGAVLGLDEHHLAGRLLEARVVQRLRGAAGLADAGLGRVERLRADGVADEERDEDEGDPAEDRRLRVRTAPTSHPMREVALGLHWVPSSGSPLVMGQACWAGRQRIGGGFRRP